jgi:hypothetical protein
VKVRLRAPSARRASSVFGSTNSDAKSGHAIPPSSGSA